MLLVQPLHLQRETLGTAVLGQDRLASPPSAWGLWLQQHPCLLWITVDNSSSPISLGHISHSSPHRRFSNWDSTQTTDSSQQHQEFLQPMLILLGLRFPVVQRNCSGRSSPGLDAKGIYCGVGLVLQNSDTQSMKLLWNLTHTWKWGSPSTPKRSPPRWVSFTCLSPSAAHGKRLFFPRECPPISRD